MTTTATDAQDMTPFVIYNIVCRNPQITESYIGSTTSFGARKVTHRIACENQQAPNYNCRVYTFMRANGGWDNWRMDVLEHGLTLSNHVVRIKRERFWYDFMARNNTLLNTNVPGADARKTAASILKYRTSPVGRATYEDNLKRKNARYASDPEYREALRAKSREAARIAREAKRAAEAQ